VNVPQMSDDERTAFNKHVDALFKARWTNGQVADWACRNDSGFGRFWESPQHALDTVTARLRVINKQIADDDARIMRELNNAQSRTFARIDKDPLAFLIESVGGKSRPRRRR
jgi:hypothetical protein